MPRRDGGLPGPAAAGEADARRQEGREREEKFWDQDDDRIPVNNDGDLGLQLTAREPVMMTAECLNEVPPTPRLKKPGKCHQTRRGADNGPKVTSSDEKQAAVAVPHRTSGRSRRSHAGRLTCVR